MKLVLLVLLAVPSFVGAKELDPALFDELHASARQWPVLTSVQMGVDCTSTKPNPHCISREFPVNLSNLSKAILTMNEIAQAHSGQLLARDTAANFVTLWSYVGDFLRQVNDAEANSSRSLFLKGSEYPFPVRPDGTVEEAASSTYDLARYVGYRGWYAFHKYNALRVALQDAKQINLITDIYIENSKR